MLAQGCNSLMGENRVKAATIGNDVSIGARFGTRRSKRADRGPIKQSFQYIAHDFEAPLFFGLFRKLPLFAKLGGCFQQAHLSMDPVFRNSGALSVHNS